MDKLKLAHYHHHARARSTKTVVLATTARRANQEATTGKGLKRPKRRNDLYGSDLWSHKVPLDYNGFWEKSISMSISMSGDFRPFFSEEAQKEKMYFGYKHVPYFIIQKSIMPPYDVLYWGTSTSTSSSMAMGMGMVGDKVTQVADVMEAGIQLVLHPDLYVVHSQLKKQSVNSQLLVWRGRWLRLNLNHNLESLLDQTHARNHVGTSWVLKKKKTDTPKKIE